MSFVPAVSEPSVNFTLLFSAARARASGDVPRSSRGRVASMTDDARATTSLSFSDAALIARLRAADERALEALVMAYYQPLVRFARGYVQSTDAAEDVVQGMFCWLWEQREAWAPRDIKAYLYTAVRRKALNELDRESVRERHRRQSMRADVVSAAVGSDQNELIADMLSMLPEPQRTVVRLRYQDALSFGEIAAVLHSTPAGVERMAQRAVASLRAYYRV